jgi:hypothetical protein
MAFDTQITDLVGGTIDQTACDQWAADACKELIHVFPSKLKEKCSTVSTLNNSATTLDIDSIGEILHVTRLSANSGGYQLPCREIPAMYGGLADDSTDLNYYATATDPVYWVDSSSDVSTLKVKPTPEATQTAVVYHITYPTVDVSAVSTIANFPDEAEHLVVLYVAIRQLLQYQSTMSSSFNTDITTAFTQTKQGLANAGVEIGLANQEVDDALTEIGEAIGLVDNASNIQVAVDGMKTAVAKFRADNSNPGLFGDPEWFTTGANVGMTKVKVAVDNAIDLIGFGTEGDKYSANYDLEANMGDIDAELTNEDIELAGARMQQAQTQMNAVQSHLSVAQAHIQEWQATVQTLVSEINSFAAEAGARFGWINAKAVVWQGELSAAQGYMATAGGYMSQGSGFIAEAGARLQADTTKYQWYSDQYVKLSAEYARGLAGLKGQLTGGA